MAKHHKIDGLNHKNLFVTVLGTGKSKVKVLDNLALGERGFSCSLHLTVFTWKRDSEIFSVSSHKDVSPIEPGPHL